MLDFQFSSLHIFLPVAIVRTLALQAYDWVLESRSRQNQVIKTVSDFQTFGNSCGCYGILVIVKT